MSPRQARRERREAERKAHKAEIRHTKALAAECAIPDLDSPRAIANRANAQLSTGPTSEIGKAIVSQNNFRHGLSGAFQVLPSESQPEFDALLEKLAAEHDPANPLEIELVQKMAQHFWLAQRAVRLQEKCFDANAELAPEKQQQFALYLRYQTTHERAFHKFTAELRTLRNEKRKSEIGFESQERKRNEEKRKQAAEERKRELHKWAGFSAQAAYEYQELKNLHLETPECRIPNRVQRILAAEAA